MADKLLKSIKFPTLPDRYVIGDSTLTEEGAAAEAKAVGDALATKADTKGRYEDFIAGGAEQLMADGYETDKEPYLSRPTGGSADVGNREYLDKIVGGTVAWNQLCNGSSVTVQSGRKYLLKMGTAWSIGASTGTAITGLTSGSDMVIDLTALFNPTIADYIYSLEQSQAGAGVAWFRQYFPKDYYPYDPGTLRSVDGVSAHETVGFNQWDEEWRNGYYNGNGSFVEYATCIASKNQIAVLANTTYYFKSDSRYSAGFRIVFYDGNGAFISQTTINGNVKFTTPSNCRYIGFSSFSVIGITTYNNDICINLSDPSRNGEYEPYTKHTYPLDSSLTLRGVPKLVDGKLTFDGDVYPPSGEVQRRYGVVDLGTLNWNAYNGKFTSAQNPEPLRKADGNINMICAKYTTGTFGSSASQGDKKIWLSASTSSATLYVEDSDYSDATTFKTAMSGVYLVYELATPTTETAEGYEQYQMCDPSGTEEFVTDSIVPVGHETRYPHDLKKKVETAPDSPSADGTYLMKRSGGKNSYMALPSTPSSNGAYVLTVTVSGGTASYSWTAKE